MHGRMKRAPIHTLRCAFEADTSDPAKHTWLMAFPVQCLSNKTHSNHRTSTFQGSSLRWHPLSTMNAAQVSKPCALKQCWCDTEWGERVLFVVAGGG